MIKREIYQQFLKYENVDHFRIFVDGAICIFLQSVEYYLIANWLHFPKCPHKDYANYLLASYFYLCSEPSNCTNVNKTCYIDSKVQYSYSKNASYYFPSNKLNS